MQLGAGIDAAVWQNGCSPLSVSLLECVSLLVVGNSPQLVRQVPHNVGRRHQWRTVVQNHRCSHSQSRHEPVPHHPAGLQKHGHTHTFVITNMTTEREKIKKYICKIEYVERFCSSGFSFFKVSKKNKHPCSNTNEHIAAFTCLVAGFHNNNTTGRWIYVGNVDDINWH